MSETDWEGLVNTFLGGIHEISKLSKSIVKTFTSILAFVEFIITKPLVVFSFSLKESPI